ncbi:hypothetical protein [Granulicella sp. L46]|uniref:hypothetical protein n=1 Tax=Granulicella sp. L46 TaxID=1641865 RepID=UPI00131E2400|nr:hypothetical protein [Granulicella sp. L46]
MRVKLQTASLHETTVMEYAQRFLFGGLVTVVATLIADKCGPVIGGLFLAFPGIFPAGLSLVEKHKIDREAAAGNTGVASGQGQASVEAAGASAGTWGLAGFALVVWKESTLHSLPVTLGWALLAWVTMSGIVWWVRDKHAALTK